VSKDNLTLLTGTPDKQRADLEQLKRKIDVHIESIEIGTKFIRAKYLGLIAQGFTDAQALELCK
jgi:hypothetical protein